MSTKQVKYISKTSGDVFDYDLFNDISNFVDSKLKERGYTIEV